MHEKTHAGRCSSDRSAATIRLSPTVWSHVLGTLFAALPLSVTTASMKPTSFTKAQLELLVVRNCELMLDTFLAHFAVSVGTRCG